MSRVRAVRSATARWLRLIASTAVVAGCGPESPSLPAAPATPALRALRIVAGDVQVGDAERELPDALRVIALDGSDKPVAGVVVNFRVVTGGGSVYAGSAVTDAQGRASDWWTLGPASADTQRVEVRAVDPVTAERRVYATFRALTSSAGATTGAPAGGFRLTAAPAAVTVPAGGSAPATIVVSRGVGFVGAVALTASGAPTGVSVTFAPPSTVGESATASVVVGGAVAPGSYPLTIRGAATGAAAQAVTLALTVTAAPSGSAGALTSGQAYAGRISRAGQTDSYTFTATQGDFVALSMGEGAASSDFYPWIRLVGPSGQVLSSRSNSATAQISLNAPTSGVYTVIVGTEDSGNDATGDYRITAGVVGSASAVVVAADDEGGALTNGENHLGAVEVGDLDQWTFAASRGDYVAVSMGEGTAASDFYPWIRLVSPTGEVLASRSNSAVAQISLNAPATGTYRVIVGTEDSGNDATGNYRVAFFRTPGAFVVPAGDDGGAMRNGVAHTGELGVGDLDAWTFTATQGTALIVKAARGATAASDFYPWIRVIGPTGELLGSRSSATVAQLNLSAPATGTYTVIVGTEDSGNDATGGYELSVTGASAVRLPDVARAASPPR